MAKDRVSRRRRFLDGYRLEDDLLVAGDIETGRPEISRGRAPDGTDVLVKFWKRNGRDPDIEDIWRSEIRQLQRLAAVPLAEDLFVPTYAHGEDGSGFTIVVNPGQGAPLEVFRRSKHQPEVISQPRLPRSKRLIWANGLRIARALDLLHSQGIIHRNVDPWAIVTSFADEADFRLTGFEWSMRIANFDRPTRGNRRATEEVASFRQDWIKFGLLLAQLLAAPPDRIANLALLPSEVADHITAAEGRTLRSILGLDDPDRLDGSIICNRIEEVKPARPHDRHMARRTGRRRDKPRPFRRGDRRISQGDRLGHSHIFRLHESGGGLRPCRKDGGSEGGLGGSASAQSQTHGQMDDRTHAKSSGRIRRRPKGGAA
jgi:hypothetical protein